MFTTVTHTFQAHHKAKVGHAGWHIHKELLGLQYSRALGKIHLDATIYYSIKTVKKLSMLPVIRVIKKKLNQEKNQVKLPSFIKRSHLNRESGYQV